MIRSPIKRLIPHLSILLLSTALFFSADLRPLRAQEEPTMGKYVLGLVMGNPKDRQLDSDMLTMTTTAFVNSRRFIMAERTKLDSIFSEKSLQEFLDKGPGSFENVLGLDMLGIVEYTLEERQDPSMGRYIAHTITVRLIDANNGQIRANITSERGDMMTLAKNPRLAGEALFENIRAAFPPVGYVIKIDDKRIVVDMGEDLGVMKGDVLEIVREGEQIIHPITGKPLEAQQSIIGTMKVVSTASSMATCKLKSTDEPVHVGDLVQLRTSESIGKRILSQFRKLVKVSN